MKKTIIWIASILVVAAIGAVGIYYFIPKEVAPDPAAEAQKAFEAKRLDILTRYENELKQKENDVLYDGDIIPQIGITILAGDLCQVERKFFQEISNWRIESAISPEELALIRQDIREIRYRLALYRQKMRIDDLESDGHIGSGTPAADIDSIASVYHDFNQLMLMPREEAIKERQRMGAPLVFTEDGRTYEVDPGAKLSFPIYYKNSDGEERESFYKLTVKKFFDYNGRQLAVFHITPDIRGIFDGSGIRFLVAELINGKWECFYLNPSDDWVDSCELEDGVINITYGFNEKKNVSVPIDR